MTAPVVENLPHFQYTSPTIAVGDLVLDTAALNAFIRRAETLYGKANVSYDMGAEADPSKNLADMVKLDIDCSAFAFWSCYLKRVWMHTENNPKDEWYRVNQPIAGATVRYDPKPGKKTGHSGVIIAPNGSDNFQTLDSTDAASPPRVGSIAYQKNGHTRWVVKGGPNVRYLVSADAIITKGGVPLNRKPNLLLAAVKLLAKHPVAAGAGGLFLLGAAGVFIYKRMRRRALR